MLKKFFWGMVFSGISMAVVQMTPLKEKFNPVFMAQLKTLQNMAKQKAGGPPGLPLSAPSVEVVEYRPPENVYDSIDEAVPPTEEEPVLLPSTQNIDGKEYVLIQGKYYEYRPDNVYDIGGEKVFFKKNKVVSAAKLKGSEVGSIPLTPGDMMKALQKAQQALAERNQVLNGGD